VRITYFIKTSYAHNLCIRKNIEEKTKKYNEKKKSKQVGAHRRRSGSEQPRAQFNLRCFTMEQLERLTSAHGHIPHAHELTTVIGT
jgi:hypothetical protein